MAILPRSADLNHLIHGRVAGEVNRVVLIGQGIGLVRAAGVVMLAEGRAQQDGFTPGAGGLDHAVDNIDLLASLGVLHEMLCADIAARQEGKLHAQGQLVDAIGLQVQVNAVLLEFDFHRGFQRHAIDALAGVGSWNYIVVDQKSHLHLTPSQST